MQMQLQSVGTISFPFTSVLSIGPITLTGGLPAPILQSLTFTASTYFNLAAQIPTGALFMILFPGASNGAMIAKGPTGDTGFHVSQINPWIVSFDPANMPTSTNFGITPGGSYVGPTQVLWF